MNVTCRLDFHKWSGCKCSRCGKIRDSNHDWSNNRERCAICGAERPPTQHASQWKGCSTYESTLSKQVDQMWSEVKKALPDIPLRSEHCKSFLLQAIKSGSPQQAAVVAFMKVFNKDPDNFVDKDVLIERLADVLLTQMQKALKNVPLKKDACKAKIINNLKTKMVLKMEMSLQDVAENLVKAIIDNPRHYMDLPSPTCFSHCVGCVSRSDVCLSMLSGGCVARYIPHQSEKSR
jgi:hypothetical protein